MKAMVKGTMLGRRRLAARLSLKAGEEVSSVGGVLAYVWVYGGERGRGTLRCYVGGCEGTGHGEGNAHAAAEGEDFVPLLCGEGGGRFHYGGHGYEGQTGVLACLSCQRSTVINTITE